MTALRTEFCLKDVAHQSVTHRTSPIDDDKYKQTDDHHCEDRSPHVFWQAKKYEFWKSKEGSDQKAHNDDKDH